jgi:hypothetical protein
MTGYKEDQGRAQLRASWEDLGQRLTKLQNCSCVGKDPAAEDRVGLTNGSERSGQELEESVKLEELEALVYVR